MSIKKTFMKKKKKEKKSFLNKNAKISRIYGNSLFLNCAKTIKNEHA